MIRHPGAASDISNKRDLNRILDRGCPRIVSGLRSAVYAALAMGLPSHLRDLDCDLFIHGYGEQCIEAEVLFAIWDVKMPDMRGKDVVISFYVTPGSGLLLLRNEVLHKSQQIGGKKLLIISAAIRVPPERSEFCRYIQMDNRMALPGYTSKYSQSRVTPSRRTS